jgi:syntaxin 1B/2/3
MAAEYRETVARRYYTVTGEEAADSTVEALISSGQSETFLRKAIQEQAAGRGQVLDTVSEIQERHGAVVEVERSLRELHQVFLDMAALVEAQGQRSGRKWACVAVVAGAVLVVVIVLPVLVNFHLLSLRR